MSDVEAETVVVPPKERSDRAVLHVAELWVAMAASDAWQQLEQELHREKHKQRAQIIGAVFDTMDEVSQRDIDFARGVIEGLSRPFQVVATAQKLIAKRNEPVKEEEPVTEEDVWA